MIPRPFARQHFLIVQRPQHTFGVGVLLAAAAVAIRHADPAKHLRRGVDFHRRNDRKKTEDHEDQHDNLLHDTPPSPHIVHSKLPLNSFGSF